jgi:hypothetical protein
MLRSDHVRAIEYVIHAKRNLKEIKRGKLDMDSANMVTYYDDNQFLGTVLGLKLQRSAALANNHIDFVDELETTTYDTTIHIATNGAFTAIDWTYTDATECGAFATGGEFVNITESSSNNGTFLSTFADANTVVLLPLPGESIDIVDEAAVTGAVFI